MLTTDRVLVIDRRLNSLVSPRSEIVHSTKFKRRKYNTFYDTERLAFSVIGRFFGYSCARFWLRLSRQPLAAPFLATLVALIRRACSG